MCVQKINIVKNIYQQRKTSKTVIRRILGENTIVKRNFDFGRFEGIAEIFGKKKKLFITGQKQNNVIDKNSINYVGCFYNNSRELENVYVFNRNNKNIDIFTKTGELIQQYSPEEAYALFCYKHDSKNIHKFLRRIKGIKQKNIENTKNIVKIISDLFKNERKHSKISEEIITYRALDRTSLRKIQTMKEGEIFTDESFTSVATKKSKIFQFLNFRNFLHPAKIKLPKDSKYISLDELHNIVLPNGRETELLLQEGNNYLITKKPKFGFIEMELLTK